MYLISLPVKCPRKRSAVKPYRDKTIIDALSPGVEALRNAEQNGMTLKEGLSAACTASIEGAEHTKQMIARHGRPAYYGDNSIGKEDPGAAVGVLIMKAFAEYDRE